MRLANARNPEQLAEMERLIASGECLFCSGRWPIITETKHWLIGYNQYPYDGTRQHLLLVPKMHVTDLIYLDHESKDDMWSVLDMINMPSYSLGVRCGDPEKTGGTLDHLHMHFVVPDGTTPVRFKMGG